MNDKEIDAVASKVRKLLALAHGNMYEAEAASATAKAQELLEAYHLDMAWNNNNPKKAAVLRAAHKGLNEERNERWAEEWRRSEEQYRQRREQQTMEQSAAYRLGRRVGRLFR